MLQCLALIGAGFIQVGVGTELMCSTVIIGALPEKTAATALNNELAMTKDEASWFGQFIFKRLTLLIFCNRHQLYPR